MKKNKDGYTTVVKDICDALGEMEDNILRDTNDRVFQFPEYRVVKLRVANSGRKLSKSNGFRLIYWVSLLHDNVVLMRVYPKRGPQAAVDLVNAEYTRLQMEVFNESKANMLHQVDVANGLAELSQNGCLSGDE
ncbi:MAG: hypothetical protein IJ675_04600 [Pseudobutyrivibrio sp.]|nr:hypothetical protein [Pseudobutyrivibrio sp.]